MSDELSPEFLAFSEMLDQEESLDSEGLDSDGQLLLELRRQLREDTFAGDLPEDFSRSTAVIIKTRYQQMPLIAKRLLAWDVLLRARVFSLRTLASVLLVTGGAYGLYQVSPVLLLSFGLAAFLGLSVVHRLYSKFLPERLDLSPRLNLPEVNLPKLFYLLPMLAVFATAAMSGWAVDTLDDLSLSVRASGAPLELAAIATAGVTWLWLMNAFIPLWKVAFTRTWITVLVTWLNGAWLLMLTKFAVGEDYIKPFITGFALLCLVLSLTAAFTPSQTVSETEWRRAFKRFFAGLLVGLLPLLVTGFLLYQYVLTRELNPSIAKTYQSAQEEFARWESEQQSVSPSENGFTELRPFFLRSELEKDPSSAAVRENQMIFKRLKDGAQLGKDYFPNGKRLKNEPENYARVRAGFLQELPRIRKAVNKPNFSYITKEPMSWSTEVPNYILARAISLALAGLVDESLQKGDSEQALDYLELNLRWSTKMRGGSLISLMISVALRSIAITDIERFVFEAKPSESQLRSLSAVLEEVSQKPSALRELMLREAILSDRYLRKLVVAKNLRSTVTEMSSREDEVTFKVLVTLFPRGFWESERKAYLNLMLSFQQEWADLATPGQGNLDEVFEMSPVARSVVPNFSRAQAQFCNELSRMAALKTVIALELYKKKEGDYPDSLGSLVPNYLTALPIDAMQPKRWEYKGSFEYRKGEAGYELVSQSPFYATISLAARQVYGPDGNYAQLRMSSKAKS